MLLNKPSLYNALKLRTYGIGYCLHSLRYDKMLFYYVHILYTSLMCKVERSKTIAVWQFDFTDHRSFEGWNS